jgi:16S rRNA (adenine1518-N6/adenine1519-N6)-dimethyltransferase
VPDDEGAATQSSTLPSLLGAGDIRALAREYGISPTKMLGQNFVVDANTVRRIVRAAGVGADDVVLEVGPGLGSLTLALLDEARGVVAVEIDPVLAAALAHTVEQRRPAKAAALEIVPGDALRLTELPHGWLPTALVANLPYNVAVPVLLTALERFSSLQRGLVMVQAEVAERLAAGAGERAYGAPSVKAAWYADVRRAGPVPRTVFWPVPNVDSGLVAFTRREPPASHASRVEVFACIDAAFAQRRKTLRAALAGWAGSAQAAEAALHAAGIDPRTRGEELDVRAFAALAAAGQATRVGPAGEPRGSS